MEMKFRYWWISVAGILTLLPFDVITTHGETLNLKIDPLFELVPENWTVGAPLPSLSICTVYNGRKNLTLTIVSGDSGGYFGFRQTNVTCSTLVLLKSLDADIVNQDGSRGQSFNLAIKCTDGWLMAYGNFDVQIVDINDNPPKFVKTDNAYMIPEDVEIGAHLFTVTTFDPDTGVGGIDSFILEDNFQNTFEIKNGSCIDSYCSAAVRLAQKLNYDSKNVYTLTVVAFDGAGRSPVVNRAKMSVVINVKDVQNNPPRFLTDARIQFVAENTPIGTEIVRVQAVDGDAGVVPHNQIFYQLLNPSPYFNINSSTGSVFISSPLDRENPEILKSSGTVMLQIVAEEDNSGPIDTKPKATLTLTIVVTDVDDERPKCNQSLYEAKIYEDAQRMIPLVFTNAQDLFVYDDDEGPNGEFELSIGGPNSLFDISPKKVLNVGTAMIRLQQSSVLDFELQKVLWLQVILKPILSSPTQIGDNIKTSSCDIRVQILDANDNVPQFGQKAFFGVIMENSKPGTIVTNVTAFDLDGPEFGPLVYSFSGIGSDLFLIDERSGIIRARRSLDREQRSEYELTVTVQDENGKGHKNSTSLKIYVADDNDNAPRFKNAKYVVYLYENSLEFSASATGSRIFMLEAFDADQPNTANTNVSYSIDLNPRDLNHGHRYFVINPNTGEIRVRPPGIDLERMKDADFFNLTVSAHDQNKIRPLSSSVQVLIYINDTNDNIPTFEREVYNVSIMENATFPTEVMRLKAVDFDRSYFNSLMAYRIINVQDKFTIDTETGVISVAENAKFADEPAYKRHYRLNIAAKDQGMPPNTGLTTVFIHIIDVNDKPPVFTEKFYHLDVMEDALQGLKLLNLTAEDPDSDVHLFYYLVGFENVLTEANTLVDPKKYNYSNLFSIHPFTGQLIVNGLIDREMMEQATLLINVTDLGAQMNTPQTDQTKVHIRVLDLNDNRPEFDDDRVDGKPMKDSITENLQVGSLLMTIKARDADKNKSIVFSLAEHSSSLVAIDPFSGEITNTGTIDYETTTLVNFTVMATDTGLPPLSSLRNYVLKILDQNDNSPIFEKFKYSSRISEQANPGTVILNVKAVDMDSGQYGAVRYFLAADNTPYSTSLVGTKGTRAATLADISDKRIDYFPFEIGSADGKISILRNLDRETTSFYTFSIKAIDNYQGYKSNDSHEAYTTVEIFLTDVNDNAPEFDLNTPRILTLTENNRAGMHIFTFHATDYDDPSTGNGQVVYKLLSVNSPRNTSKIKELFVVDQSTGTLRLNKDLSQFYGVYELLIEASDRGVPKRLVNKLTVKIEVQDVNDNAPLILFPTKGASFVVPENNYTDYREIIKVQAIDYDADLNSDIRFSLKKTTANEDWKYFKIDAISGRLYPRQAFDYEKQKRYHLAIIACDRGEPPLCSENDIFIEILDKDDNCPYFDHAIAKSILEIRENSPLGSFVGHLPNAFDKDGSFENRIICYEITDDFGNDLFRLTSTASDNLGTPQVIVSSEIDREKADQYWITIKVTDCNNNKNCGSSGNQETLSGKPVDPESEANLTVSSYIILRINVLDENDNDPVFLQPVFIGGVQYGTKMGTRVTKIRAIDADLVDQDKLRYFLDGQIFHSRFNNLNNNIVNENRKRRLVDLTESGSFHVDAVSGDVTTTISFTSTWHGFFEFYVIVKDSGDRVAKGKVIVNVLSYEQQIELTFDSEANVVWDNAQEIINLLSVVTESNATIDDVQAHYGTFGVRKAAQSKVLVHFVGKNSSIMAVEEVLQYMDMPKSQEQKRSKQELLVNQRLRYANRNSNPLLVIAGQEITLTHYGLLAALGCLSLTIVFLLCCWCVQSKNYKQRLKAATTKAYHQSGLPVPTYGLPGTNKHASSNPIWRAQYNGNENYGFDSDKNSLDENEITTNSESKPLPAGVKKHNNNKIVNLGNGRLLPRIPQPESPPMAYFYQTEKEQQTQQYYIDQRSKLMQPDSNSKSSNLVAVDNSRQLSFASSTTTKKRENNNYANHSAAVKNDLSSYRPYSNAANNSMNYANEGSETASSPRSFQQQQQQQHKDQHPILSYLESTEL